MVLNAVAAVDPNSQFLLSTEMLTVLAEKYSSTLNLDLERLQSQAEVAKNTFPTGERPTTSMQLFAELSKMQRAFPDLLELHDLFLYVITLCSTLLCIIDSCVMDSLCTYYLSYIVRPRRWPA